MLYIDDLLLLHQDRIQLARGMAVALSLLQKEVGLNINTTKCVFAPLQRFQCLGFLWDTLTMATFVPVKRLAATQRQAGRLLGNPATHNLVRVRDLARFVGQATAMFMGLRGARRYLFLFNKNWDMRSVARDGEVPLRSPRPLDRPCSGGCPRTLEHATGHL